MSITCGKPNCKNLRLKMCSAYLNEGYSGTECQKEDWRIHKILCLYMKNYKEFLPYTMVRERIRNLMEKAGVDRISRILEYTRLFAEYQFGDMVVGRSFRQRSSSGDRMDDYKVDILVFFAFISTLVVHILSIL